MSTPLENLISDATSLLNNKLYAEAAKVLHKHREQLGRNPSNLSTVLATLQPNAHTIVVAVVLRTRLAATNVEENIDSLHATVAEFIKECDILQLAHVQNYVCDILEDYGRLLVAANCPFRGINVLSMAVRKLLLCTSQQHITGAHHTLLHLCLMAKCLKPAQTLLQCQCLDIAKENEGVNIMRYLLYFYYGGLVFCALKKFDRAQHFFNICISTPAFAISHIMVEAYKKFIIVSLIQDGKVPKLSKHTSGLVPRFIRPISQLYVELNAAYLNGPDALHQCINQHQQVFTKDGNIGLVKQLWASQQRKCIQRLTKTFLTLSLSDVAARVHLDKPQDAQTHLLNMIEQKEIYASINQKDGMVLFKDNPERYDTQETLDLMNEKLEKIEALERQIGEMEEAIVVDPRYIHKVASPVDDDLAIFLGSSQS